MTYQVLARKWRPRNFGEMAGQGHVLKTLINSLDQNRLHHAYLFTGTRGVGKTTIARILAKCLNCGKGVSSTPCGECGECREIDEGRFIDLIEVDAASRTKVEDTRELLENVQYSPTRGRYKVYLVDEVHMLSGHSFNALLKTLEEPPPHVKFLLATTDPQKLPVTVLSRCLQFNLKNLSPEQMVDYMTDILEREEIPCEPPALWQIARAARGSVRDALTLLDQAIAYCEGSVTDSGVRALLGTIDQKVIHDLVEALAARDAGSVLSVIAAAAEHAPDFTAVLEDLLSYLHRVAVAQVVPEGIDNSQGDREAVLAHALAMPAEDVQLYYQIALKGREELPLAVDARSGVEMTLLRMLAFTPEGVPVAPGEPLDAGYGEASPADTGAAEAGEPLKKKRVETGHDEEIGDPGAATAARAARAAGAAPVAPRVTGGPAEAAGMPVNESNEEAVSTQSASHEKAEESETEQAVPEKQFAAGARAPGKAPAADPAELDAESWIEVFHALGLTGITGNLAANSSVKSASPGRVTLVIEKTQASVYSDEHRKRVEKALCEYFDTALVLAVETGEVRAETPAAWRRRKEQERLRQARETFENDSNVQEILRRFSGSIDPGSIVPLTPGQH